MTLASLLGMGWAQAAVGRPFIAPFKLALSRDWGPGTNRCQRSLVQLLCVMRAAQALGVVRPVAIREGASPTVPLVYEHVFDFTLSGSPQRPQTGVCGQRKSRTRCSKRSRTGTRSCGACWLGIGVIDPRELPVGFLTEAVACLPVVTGPSDLCSPGSPPSTYWLPSPAVGHSPDSGHLTICRSIIGRRHRFRPPGEGDGVSRSDLGR